MHVFEILGEPVRRRIVELLASGSAAAGELADVLVTEFRIGRSAVSHHLAILRREQFVVVWAEGSVRRYRLSWDALDRLDRAADELWEKWDRRYGWPYLPDPLASPPRSHRAGRRGERGRTRPNFEEPMTLEEGEAARLAVEPLAYVDEWTFD